MPTLELEARVDNLLATAQAETADIDLFAPILEREECTICMTPLPILTRDTRFMYCCGKLICCGCSTLKQMITDKNKKKGVKHEMKCAFCCQPNPKNEIKALKRLMKKNSPVAYTHMAERYKKGDGVLQSDTKSLEMLVCAAELGYIGAYSVIGHYFRKSDMDATDDSLDSLSFKSIELMEVAAKKGDILAHIKLAEFHEISGNTRECIQHTVVAANAGYKPAMDVLMDKYKQKLIPKEDLTRTLRQFQASYDEMKSKDRDDFREFSRLVKTGTSPRDAMRKIGII